jgi:hypothetical protein
MNLVFLALAAVALIYGIGKAIVVATKDEKKTEDKLSAGSFEVPLAIGASVWLFIVFLINVLCLKPCGVCEQDKCCKEGEKCEMQQTAPAAEHH